MQGHAGDAGIFIRSMATRGFLGGLARTTGDATLVLDASGKHTVLIETVGVGQDEVDIVRLADCTLVVMVPGLGDDVQGMKAGLMEIADIFVLNKADQEGADRLEQQLSAMLELAPERNGWKPPVIRTVATENKGIEDLLDAISRFRKHFDQGVERQNKRISHWKQRLLAMAVERFTECAVPGTEGEAALDALAHEVADRKKDPYVAVREILSRAGL
jgi:LAO/AO transport system kinase